jgi:hypothetical protein
LATFPVPLVAPFVPDLSDAVPLTLLCDEHDSSKNPHNAISEVLSENVIFMAILFCVKLQMRHAVPL